ncbi:MAG TPA: hypothetical protein VGK35_10400, partial [Actinotalea sp.]
MPESQQERGERRRRREEERLRALEAQQATAAASGTAAAAETEATGERASDGAQAARVPSRRELRERAQALAAAAAAPAAAAPAAAAPVVGKTPVEPVVPVVVPAAQPRLSRRQIRESATGESPAARVMPVVEPPAPTGGIRRVSSGGGLSEVEPTSQAPRPSRRRAAAGPVDGGSLMSAEERTVALRAQAARAQAEREEQARVNAERAQAQRSSQRPGAAVVDSQLQRERAEREQAARERLQRERGEYERAEAERAERERAERERAEREQAEREQAERASAPGVASAVTPGRAVHERALRERAAQQRAAEERAAEQRALWQRAAEERAEAARQAASDDEAARRVELGRQERERGQAPLPGAEVPAQASSGNRWPPTQPGSVEDTGALVPTWPGRPTRGSQVPVSGSGPATAAQDASAPELRVPEVPVASWPPTTDPAVAELTAEAPGRVALVPAGRLPRVGQTFGSVTLPTKADLPPAAPRWNGAARPGTSWSPTPEAVPAAAVAEDEVPDHAELPARRRALSILLHAAVLIVVAFILGMLVYMVLLRDTPTTGAEGAG